MQSSPVTGNPVYSPVMLVGQAPGDKEPVRGRPFAWTAGKTLFQWFQDACGMPEKTFRQRVYMAAVCRCFPGKKPQGGDRVPSQEEIAACAHWLQAEMGLLTPRLVIPVGKLAIAQFIAYQSLEAQEPGKSLLRKALQLIAAHPSMMALATLPEAQDHL